MNSEVGTIYIITETNLLAQHSRLVSDWATRQNISKSLASYTKKAALTEHDIVIINTKQGDFNVLKEFSSLGRNKAKLLISNLDDTEAPLLLGQNLYKLIFCWTDASVSLQTKTYAGAFLYYREGKVGSGSFARDLDNHGAPYAELETIKKSLEVLINEGDYTREYLYLITDSEWSINVIYSVLKNFYSITFDNRFKQYNNLKDESISRANQVIESLLRFKGFTLAHVKGHTGIHENEFCDKLAVSTRKEFLKGRE